MTEDASLDAFASSAADDEDDDAATEAAEKPDSETSADSERAAEPDAETDSADSAAESFEPAVSTYAWSPAGAACADCGESVEKRWRAGGQRGGSLVCADCKEWRRGG